MNKLRIGVVIAVSLIGLLLGATLTKMLISPTRTVVEPIDVSVPGGAKEVFKKERKSRTKKLGDSTKGSQGGRTVPPRRRGESSDDGFQPAPSPQPVRADDDDDDDPDETDDDSGDD